MKNLGTIGRLCLGKIVWLAMMQVTRKKSEHVETAASTLCAWPVGKANSAAICRRLWHETQIASLYQLRKDQGNNL